MDRRLRRGQRLSKAVEFRAIFAGARACQGEYFTLLGKANQLAVARLGLAIAKRRLRLAVRRNKVKRVVRESFRHHQHQLAGVDVVVLARDRAAAATPRRLRASLDAQWPRLVARMDLTGARRRDPDDHG